MTKLITQFIVVFILCCGTIFGAWLAGAGPTIWAFILAVAFSAVLVAMINSPIGKGPK